MTVLSLSQGVAFCLATSVAFVGSLYVVVPEKVRKLHRDHPRQIQWRSLATGLVCLGSYAGQRYLLAGSKVAATFYGDSTHASNVLATTLHTLVASSKVLAHVAILYLGPLIQGSIPIVHGMRWRDSCNLWEYVKALYGVNVEPTIRALALANDKNERSWITRRNLVIAPLLEEVAFRTCMVPVLLAAGLGPISVCWTAPIFFGVAHLHHAAQRLREGIKPSVVAIQTAIQFAYTLLFGAYASYAYLQTQSTTAIVLAHGFCNWMGLPNFLFFQKQHLLYDYRNELIIAHLIGLAGFGAALAKGLLSCRNP